MGVRPNCANDPRPSLDDPPTNPTTKMKTTPIGSFLACTFFAFPALAQDSVSKINTPPGDALSSYDTAEQINDYVVELTPFVSSGGHGFGLAPIVKASEPLNFSPPFFTHLISGHCLSKDTLAGVPFARNTYSKWTAQGFGIHNSPTVSDPGTPIDTSNFVGSQFAASFAEFGGPGLNSVISAVGNFENDAPSRLYMSRIVGAVNSSDYMCNLAQLGLGGVDADGNVALRSDGFGTANGCGFLATTGDNYWRVDLLARGSTLNVLHNLGATDFGASTRLVTNASSSHITPTVIPESLVGRPVLIGSNFNNQFVFESSAGSVSNTGTHLAFGVQDTRGSVSHTPESFPSLFGASNTGGTSGFIGLDNTFQATTLNVVGLNSNGGVAGTLGLVVPTVITDNATGWPSDSLAPVGAPAWSAGTSYLVGEAVTNNSVLYKCTIFHTADASTEPGVGASWTMNWKTVSLEFSLYGSQTAFRGGNGQVAIGRDQNGRMLVAAVADHPDSPGNQNEHQLIAVARVSNVGPISWTVAAYSEFATNSMFGSSSNGKPILDETGSEIGRLVSLVDLTVGSQPGPSMSPPMMDSVGNLYFLAVVEIDLPGGGFDTDTGLVRAIYDPASFSYDLELLFDTGDVFVGQNSATPYQIRFMDIADSNSISSATSYSGDIAAGAFNHADPAGLLPNDSRTLGGMTINAQILYDVDGDGAFDIQTGSGGVPGSVDEDYRVLLYVTSAQDCNENGVADDLDLIDGTSVDLNGDGRPDDCSPPLGTPYCLSLPNSSGFAAIFTATGSDSVSANNVDLFAGPVPLNVPGLFIYGANQLLQPFGDGFRCVGAGAVGLFRVFPFSNGGSAGVMVRNLDLTTPPNPAGQIFPGSTWNFQNWFRDPTGPGGTGFNLSNALEITFTP